MIKNVEDIERFIRSYYILKNIDSFILDVTVDIDLLNSCKNIEKTIIGQDNNRKILLEAFDKLNDGLDSLETQSVEELIEVVRFQRRFLLVKERLEKENLSIDLMISEKEIILRSLKTLKNSPLYNYASQGKEKYLNLLNTKIESKKSIMKSIEDNLKQNLMKGSTLSKVLIFGIIVLLVVITIGIFYKYLFNPQNTLLNALEKIIEILIVPASFAGFAAMTERNKLKKNNFLLSLDNDSEYIKAKEEKQNYEKQRDIILNFDLYEDTNEELISSLTEVAEIARESNESIIISYIDMILAQEKHINDVIKDSFK